ncbi:PP2C family protein-serine/threonine phosphatase [Hoyosella altamirensis]|uniref:Serine/threonine protein phosphatase PrpC n=1 Tax=Hoyosella altamirensis TaxID=616997 RepID=A0A839RMY4_9ACTN|nr:protein phosphatase 2C domain-containing protein [Hoyosella altamirensis]MBB3037291.1 serine/threonine protein phosphatase PrpC [Hoyosella altamirensis]
MRSLQVSAITDRGLLRARNEDAIAVGPLISQVETGTIATVELPLDRPVVLAVADGLGGHPAGNVASWLTVTELVESSAAWETPGDISKGVAMLHTAVRRAASTSTEFRGMGTTFAALVITQNTVYCVNVGDSPIFKIEKNDMTLVSIDDAALDAAGRPTHAITQVVGSSESPVPHVSEVQPALGRFLICSDGVSGFTNQEDIVRVCRESSPADALSGIIGLVLSSGARDNYSALLVDITE